MNPSDFPAFPIKEPLTIDHPGMMLRDYFAAQIISSLIASPLRQGMTLEQDAFYAYKVADAMLVEREKSK